MNDLPIVRKSMLRQRRFLSRVVRSTCTWKKRIPYLRLRSLAPRRRFSILITGFWRNQKPQAGV
jgi:hypothetical protein